MNAKKNEVENDHIRTIRQALIFKGLILMIEVDENNEQSCPVMVEER